MADLTPAPLSDLLRRAYHERLQQASIFDLPTKDWYLPAPGLDTSVRFHGLPAGTALGPAAGPHDQMAQNLVLAWLGGSRIMELKTVQVLDELTIERPCIDITNVGFNIEWSQELKLRESLVEYVKGAMIIEILAAEDVLGLGAGPSDPRLQTIFDMSVGYDLEGISSPAVRQLVDGLKDASAVIDSLRSQIPEEYAGYRDHGFRTQLVKTATLSTFHGCPRDEIERICQLLIADFGLHTIIKLNPVQLGRAELEHVLYDVLGYTHLRVNPHAYESALSLEEAMGIVERLEPLARAHGLNVGVKFSNTLEVENSLGRVPGDLMYLSGAPLHVIAVTLVERWRRLVGTRFPVSFAAGVDARNFANAVALGLAPVTVCTDLLRPRGYGRQLNYLRRLEEAMRQVGASSVQDYIVAATGQADGAVHGGLADWSQRHPARAAAVDLETLEARLVESVTGGTVRLGDLLAREPGLEGLAGAIVDAAILLNTPVIVDRTVEDRRYSHAQNCKAPNRIESHLHLFDCISCDKCVPVCPNDANFVYEVEPAEFRYRDLRLTRGVLLPDASHHFFVEKRTQIANFADFCNQCGNCDTFCPEYGGPFIEKPAFFGSLDLWRARASQDGFFVNRDRHLDLILGRIESKEYRLLVDRSLGTDVFSDGVVELTLSHSNRQLTGSRIIEERMSNRDPSHEPMSTIPDHVVEMRQYHRMASLLDGVLDASRVNPVNIKYLQWNPSGLPVGTASADGVGSTPFGQPIDKIDEEVER